MSPPPYLGSVPPAAQAGGTVAAPAPERAPGVELLGSLVGSGYRRAPGLVRRGDGQTVQLTPLLYTLLELVDGGRDAAALATALGRRVERRVSAGDVDQLLGKLRPLGLLGTGDGSVQDVRKANPLLALTCKVVVTDPAVTRRITAPFAALFSPLVVWPTMVLFALTCWFVLVEKGLASAASEAIYSPGLLLAVFALTVLSAGFHEFGHAAACRYGGATPGVMGFGLYLLWPAFYTDVDDSYRLSRWGRLRVDLGGLYFNALVAVAFAGIAVLTGVDALLLVVATQLLQMVRQLAPFIRADGYHLLADLTGVPDLFAHIGPTLRGLLPGGWGRPSPLARWARVVVTAWVLVMVPLLLGLLVFLVYLLPRLAATAWDSLGVQGGLLRQELAEGDAVMIATRVLALVSVLLPVAAISYLLARIARRTAVHVLRATDDRPQARLVAGLAAAFLAAVAAGAWWPSGQYVPVQAPAAAPPAVAAAPASGPSESEPVALAPEEPRPSTRQVVRTTVTATATPPATTTASEPVTPATASELQTVPAGPRTRPWPFPFGPPAGPRPHDNQALAVGLTDGAVVYDVATSWEWVTDGRAVDHRNEAWALTSCEGCSTVAVAFQVVLVVGQSDVYAPVNTAAGLNYECSACQTRAVAVQLVATLTELPDGQTLARLRALWAQVQGLEGRVRGLTVEQTYALLKQVEAQFLTELDAAGVLASSLSSTEQGGDADPTAEPQQAVVAPAEEPADEPGDALDAPATEATADPVDDGEPAPEPTVISTAVDPGGEHSSTDDGTPEALAPTDADAAEVPADDPVEPSTSDEPVAPRVESEPVEPPATDPEPTADEALDDTAVREQSVAVEPEPTGDAVPQA